MPFDSGLRTGVKHGIKFKAVAKSGVSLGGVGAAVVREMLDRIRDAGIGEALLHRLQHHVAHIRSADAGAADGGPGDDLAIEGIDDEGKAEDVTVPAGELEAVGAPAQVRAQVGTTRLALPRALSASGGGRLLLRQARNSTAASGRWRFR